MNLTVLGHRLRKLAWRVFRPPSRGVKILARNAAGEVLLVRHTYVSSHLFMIPGGGIRPFEKPEAAAVREIREETGCRVSEVALFATYVSAREGKRDTIWFYTGTTADAPIADGREIAEAAFFAPDASPETASPATLRRLAELEGRVPPAAEW